MRHGDHRQRLSAAETLPLAAHEPAAHPRTQSPPSAMFYSSELLSRSGKTPLARLWQMAHDVRVNKKVIEEFDIAGEPPRACVPPRPRAPRAEPLRRCLGHD